MKKIKYLLFALLLIPVSVNAATINCSAPGSVVSGDTFNVTFSGNLSSPASIWFGKIGSGGNATYVSGGLSIEGEEGASFSRTVTFKAGNPGSANFYIYDMDASDGNETYTDSGSCTVSIVAASSSNSSSGGSGGGGYTYVERSSNNNLSSIKIDGVTLTPEFDKDNLEYNAIVEGKTEKINVTAELEDDSAYVDGLGEKELVEGVNRIELKVTAENGDEKVYVIEITRKEKDPIEVIINKKKYTVLKKESEKKPPKGFEKTNIVIDKQDVVAYQNKKLNYTLVLLVDEEGNSNFYIYNSKNSTYIKYNELGSKDLRLIITKADSIPTNYKRTKIKINNEEVEAYYIRGVKDFKLVYAINANNGEESFYQYDSKENTFQRYNNKLLSSVESFSKQLEVGLVIAGALVLILMIIIISQASSKRKLKKVLKNRKENDAIQKIVDKEVPKKEIEKKEEVKKEEKKEIKQEEKKELPPKEEPVKEEPKLSKKELRKIQKEEKEKLKQQQKEFLE